MARLGLETDGGSPGALSDGKNAKHTALSRVLAVIPSLNGILPK